MPRVYIKKDSKRSLSTNGSIRVKLYYLKQLCLQSGLPVNDLAFKTDIGFDEIAKLDDRVLYINSEYLELSKQKLMTWIKTNIFHIRHERKRNNDLEVAKDCEEVADKSHHDLSKFYLRKKELGILEKNGVYYRKYKKIDSGEVFLKPVTVFEILGAQ
jgi:hypothetical protein